MNRALGTIEPGLLEDARALHASVPVVDLHADPLLWSRLAGYDLNRRHRNRLPRSPYWAHSDVPRWQEAGVNVVLAGVVTLPRPLGWRSCHAQALATIDCARRAVSASGGAFSIIEGNRTVAAAAKAAGVGAVLALEGAQAFEGDLGKLELLIDLGVRSVGLAHFSRNPAVAPSYGFGGDRGPLATPSRAAEGLTPHGREVVELLNARRVAIDLAHVSRSGFSEALEVSKTPPFVSHTGLASAYPHWRNIDDAQVRAVAERGGVIGIIFAGRYLGGAGIEALVVHLEHAIAIAGEEHVALGSDFDGMVVPVRELPDIAHLPVLTAHLLARGWNQARLARVLGGNAVRYLSEVLA